MQRTQDQNPGRADSLIDLNMLQVVDSNRSGCSSCGSCSTSCGSSGGTKLLSVEGLETQRGRFNGELGERERDLRRPFTHRFRTKQSHYIYDVNTNRIVQVNAAIYDIIDDFGVLSVAELIQKHRETYSSDEILDAYRSIETAHHEEHLFTNNHASEIMYPLDEQSLRLLYDESIRTLCLGVTEQCNLRCSYCAYSGTYTYMRDHNSTYMSWEVARQALDFLVQHSVLCEFVNLSFYGGEPLLNARLIRQCVEYANEAFGRKPVRYHMTTNGTLLTAENRKMLVENDFSIMVSLDGPKEIHDRYRVNARDKGSYDTIAGNLTALQEMAPDYYRNNVRFSMVLPPPYDFEALDKFINESPLGQVRNIRTTFVNTQDTTFFDQFTAEEVSHKQGLDSLKQRYRDALIHEEIDMAKPSQQHKLAEGLFGDKLRKLAITMEPTSLFPEVYHPGGICIPGMKTLFASPTGKFFTCEKGSTTSDLLCLGTVETGLDAEKGAANIASYSAAHDGCRYCYASRHCGTCFVKAYSDGRFDGATKMAACNNHRTGFHQDLIEMVSLLEENSASLDYLRNVRLTY